VSGDGWSADLSAHSAATGRSSTFAGRYTLVFPSASNGDPAVPQGDGYAAATVNSKGSVSLAGALPDGTKLTQSVALSPNGDWPFYVSRKGQQILGFLNVAEIKEGGGDGGQLTWSKPANSDRFFPNAFSLQIDVLASEFERPASSVPILNFSDGVITLTGGNLSSDLSSPVTIGSNNKVTSGGGLKATLNKTSGLFSGSAMVNGRRIKFNGALLQDQDMGSGFFLGIDSSGRVTLEPR